MKRKLKKQPRPTALEKEKLKSYIWMADWHFEETIKKKCTEISSSLIYWDNDNKECDYAYVYGLEAIKGEAKEHCIANIFIRYLCRVYQMTNISDSAEIIRLLKKEAAYDEYQELLWEQKSNEKKKKDAAKAKVKKLPEISKRKVA